MVSFANRVRVSTATTGTGTITLGSAQTGYASFAEGGIANGATIGYCIEDGNDFEVGRGTYNSSLQTLTRTVLLSKRNGEVASSLPLNLSGTAKIFVTAVAEDIVNPDLAVVDLLGVGTTPDATNRLSVNSPAVLFNHAGTNSQVKINKASAGNTASYLFQNDFSTRAEVGLVGNDDFQFKVSPDGSTFHAAINIDKDDGAITFPAANKSLTTIGAGKKTKWIPAVSWFPLTAPAAAAVNFGMAAPAMAFDSTAAEFAVAVIAMPKSWNKGTVSFQVYWAHPATATNFTVHWVLGAQAYSNDDALTDSASFSGVNDTGGTTNDLYISPESGNLTIAGTPAENDLVRFVIFRDPTDVADTLAVDAYLLGVKIFYTTNANTDD